MGNACRYFVTIFSCLFPLLSLKCQPVSNYLTSISFQQIESGMSQNSVVEILEDEQGFLWIGTPNGLNRYDGTHFEIFEKSDEEVYGLTNGYVEDLFEDENGLLWITTNSGLNIYNRTLNRVEKYRFDHPEGASLQAQYIRCIYAKDSVLWMGTELTGLYRYDLKSKQLENLVFKKRHESGPNDNFIEDIFPLRDGNWIVFTQASIYIVNSRLELQSEYTSKPLHLTSVLREEGDTFWLGTTNGELLSVRIGDLLQISVESREISRNYAIRALEKDREGNIWVGTENGGLIIYTIGGKLLRLFKEISDPHSIGGNSIWSIRRTRNNVMWVGLYKNGLSFYDPAFYKFEHIQSDPFDANSLSNDVVNCFLEDEKGNIWVGTDGGGLNYWDRGKQHFERLSHENNLLSSNVVLSLLPFEGKKMWIGTWGAGIDILDLETGTRTNLNKENSFLPSNNVMSMVRDKKGRIWIASLFGGLSLYDPKTDQAIEIPLWSERDKTLQIITVARLLEDSEANIWVGTQTEGTFKLTETTNGWQIKQYAESENPGSLSNNFINTIIEDENGTIWLGTQAGLNKYHKTTDSFAVTTKSDGLADDAVQSIIKDDEGFLWLGTNKGIIKYHPTTHESARFDRNDGLQGNEFNASSVYRSSRGELFFGGTQGFNFFKPEEILRSTEKPAVYISALKIFNQQVFPGDQFGILEADISQTKAIQLAHDHSVINFEFRSISYRHPYKIHYAYFLEGFEEDWNYVGQQSSATYTNLNPGAYTLRVKSTNNDGIWNDKEIVLTIYVNPPFWGTWWFRAAVVFFLLAWAYGIYLLRTRQIRQYQKELERQIRFRTQELEQQKEKLVLAADELAGKNEEIRRFAFSVSHDLKSPLASIDGLILLMDDEMNSEPKTSNQLAKFKEYIGYIRTTTQAMNSLIHDITEIARLGKIENKIERLNAYDVIDQARSLVLGKLQNHNTELAVAEDLPDIYGDRNRIIQVFENLIDNAIKYIGAQTSPQISIDSKGNGSETLFRVSDNGAGIEPSLMPKLFAPFERFDTNVKGTGLGLYMIQKIIESHHGKIWAESDGKGKGTTFIFSLPRGFS